MTKYEYKLLKGDDLTWLLGGPTQDRLNELGAAGWDLVVANESAASHTRSFYLFKRPIEE